MPSWVPWSTQARRRGARERLFHETRWGALSGEQASTCWVLARAPGLCQSLLFFAPPRTGDGRADALSLLYCLF